MRPGATRLVVAGLTWTMMGCLEPGGPARPAAGSAGPAGGGQFALPAYVYPDRPPTVDRRSLGALLTGLDEDYAVLWVMVGINDESAATATALSDKRHSLRAAGTSLVGLYTGPPSQWGPALLPMLRGAGANFVCVVVAPPARAGLAAWLTGNPRQFQPGLYVVDRSDRVVARFGAGPDGVAAMIADLNAGRLVPASRGAWAGPELHARVRLIELCSGKVIARATADAADAEVLVSALAHQLAATVRPAGTVAVIPIRRVGAREPGADVVASSPGSLLADHLARRGWPSVVGPASAGRTLAELRLGALEVEFAPSRLAPRVAWEAMVVGSVECRPRPGG